MHTKSFGRYQQMKKHICYNIFAHNLQHGHVNVCFIWFSEREISWEMVEIHVSCIMENYFALPVPDMHSLEENVK